MKLDIGCGKNKREGYVGIDVAKDSDADIIASALSIPVKDAVVDEVNCSHLMEHLYPEEAQKFFDEIFRVLKEGGEASLKVDRDWTRQRLLSKDPAHKYRYNKREIESMVTNFRAKKVKNEIYRFGRRIRNKIFVELRK
jgi:predicted SAM-dependent methyltransferase